MTYTKKLESHGMLTMGDVVRISVNHEEPPYQRRKARSRGGSHNISRRIKTCGGYEIR